MNYLSSLPLEASVQAASASDGVQQILTKVQESVTIEEVVTIVGTCLAASVGFFLLYWGGRKVVAAVSGGLKKGKLKAF